MRDRESMRMKNFIFKSSNNSDLLKIFMSLEIIKKQNRAFRDDITDIKHRLTSISRQITDRTPNIEEREEEYPEEEYGTTKDIPEGD